jgi:hypothetical protein
MAATIQLRCPTCGKYLAFEADRAGTISICGGCGGAVVVPEVRPGALERPEPAERQPPTPAPGLLDDELPTLPPEPVAAPPPPVVTPMVRRVAPPPSANVQALNAMGASAVPPPIPANLPAETPAVWPPQPTEPPDPSDSRAILWIALVCSVIVILGATQIITGTRSRR